MEYTCEKLLENNVCRGYSLVDIAEVPDAGVRVGLHSGV